MAIKQHHQRKVNLIKDFIIIILMGKSRGEAEKVTAKRNFEKFICKISIVVLVFRVKQNVFLML